MKSSGNDAATPTVGWLNRIEACKKRLHIRCAIRGRPLAATSGAKIARSDAVVHSLGQSKALKLAMINGSFSFLRSCPRLCGGN